MAQKLDRQPCKIKRNIVLVGVAGVGKTTVGKLAAEQLDMPFF